MMSDYDNAQRLPFRQKSRRRDWLAAAGSGHGGANQEYLRVRNSNAHPLVPLTTATAAQNDGEPATSGGAEHGYGDNKGKLRNSSRKRVPEHLGTTRMLPEHGGGPKVVGGALAAEMLAGTEEENVEEPA